MYARRHAAFRAWAGFLVRRRRTVLWLAAGLTALSLLATTRIEIRAGRVDLLGDDDPVARAWLDYGADFGSPNGIVLLLEGGTAADRRRAVDVLVELLRAREHDLYRNILYRVDPKFQRAFGAYYLQTPLLRRAQRGLDALTTGAPSTWPAAFNVLETQLKGLGRTQLSDPNAAAALESVAQVTERWARVLETGTGADTPFTFALSTPLAADRHVTPVDDDGYLTSNDGVRHLVLIDPRSEREDAAGFLYPFMTTLYDAIDTAETTVPDVHVRLTGMSAYAFQDLVVISTEIPWLTLASLLGLVLIFRAAFRSLRPGLYAGAALLLSLCWTLGITALTIGYLTLLSSVFGLILVGLGIDYGIYLVVLYTQARRTQAPAAALETAYVSGVNGILTGGATTAAAFALCSVADFAAFAELGIITAIGICCNLVAMLAVLPALLLTGEARAEARGATLVQTAGAAGRLERTFGALGRSLERRLWIGPALGVLAVLWAVPKLGRVEFDYTFLNMQPAHSPFPKSEEILFNTTNFAPHFNLVLADDVPGARALAKRLEALDTVRNTQHVGLLVPEADAERDQLIRTVQAAALALSPPRQPTQEDLEAIDSALDRIRLRFAAFERVSFSIENKAVLQRVQRIVRGIERVRAMRQELEPAEWLRRHTVFLDATSRAWETLRGHVERIAPAPPTLEDIPPEFVRRFVGTSGRQAVYVIPTHTLWDITFLLRFNADVATVSPDVRGIGMLLAQLFRHASAAPRQVGSWVGAVILLVLFLDYRDVRPVAAACAALALGVVCVVGVMHLRGMRFNPINILAFPLLLGIGIDNSVHMLHRFRSPDRPSFETAFRTTGKAVFLASLTSFVSFGLLSMSTHRGLSSFGQVMATGIVTCYVAAVVVLPCCWRLGERVWGAGGHTPDTIES